MKRFFILNLFLCFTLVGCSIKKEIRNIDCNDRESVIAVANKIAQKKYHEELEDLYIYFEESHDSYCITYVNRECSSDPLCKGGEFYITVTKIDCKMIFFETK
ncbi:hypothetical protein LJC25_05560 [Bacteroidales bacterium OttesenSCG-928-K03]|nr:hypothetical protein [Odoribacter sp. OttesenSCG-928-L07]MDL2241007.1 hypothetical protein [Bacteroidales bacterium OttesenSCG-928-K22]MDL2243175.1 hypothetical protein [Bacteroidales bacterium OttesenSCG-928-K03]